MFVESYGRVAVQDSSFSPAHRRRARAGQRTAAGGRLLLAQRLPHLADLRRPQLAGAFHPAVGGHGRRPVALRPARRGSNRLTLTRAFKRAGWRAVGAMPGEPPGVAGGLDLLPLRRRSTTAATSATAARASACRRCPTSTRCWPCSAASSPSATGRRVFAEVDLISSHAPWTRIPRLIPWDDVGDGSIFDRIPAEESTQAALFGDADAGPQPPTGTRSSTRCARSSRSCSATATTTSCSSCWATISPRRSSPARTTRATTCRSRSSPTTRR